MVSDPVGMHYVDSFAKPGRNITGFTPFEPSLGSKWVSVLKEIAPNVQHIGLVHDPEPGNNSPLFRKAIDEGGNSLHILSIETLGQRFLGSNHIRRPQRACRTMCG
jgi:putative ABC transport system substrate-binding protein